MTRRWPSATRTIRSKAKSLIAESGLTDISFDLYNRANSFWPVLGQLIQADLANVGITVNLQSLEDAEFFDQAQHGQGASVPERLDVGQRRPGQRDVLAVYASSVRSRALGYKNETGQRAQSEAQVTADPDARAALYVEAQKLIMDDAIMVVLGYPEKAIGAQGHRAESWSSLVAGGVDGVQGSGCRSAGRK